MVHRNLKIGIVDLGISNITSVSNAFTKIGFSCCYLEDKNDDDFQVDVSVLPGVGNFGYLASCLSKSTLKSRILDHHKRRAPIIGICLGMHILFDSSCESPLSLGFGIISGEIKSLKAEAGPDCRRPVPNIGYNKVVSLSRKKIFSSEQLAKMSGYYYFLHSYAMFDRQSEVDFEGITKFGDKEFLAFFLKDNICGIQFHPERSGEHGLFFLVQIMNHFEKNRAQFGCV